MPAILGQIAFGFELRNGGRIRGVAVGVDDSWRRMVRAAQRFDEKALGRDRVLLKPRGENPGSLPLSPPPGRGNATCLSPGRTSRPGASCHSSV